MSWSDTDEENEESRWKELQEGPLVCDSCQQRVTDKMEVVACRMPPTYVLDIDDSHPNGCQHILCRSCAKKPNPLPFQPCQCFTLGDHEHILWCADCTKNMKKCRACDGFLCQYCVCDETKKYGVLCQFCVFAMSELLGGNPEGVTFCSPPWPRYSISDDTKQAVQKLHDKVMKQQSQSDGSGRRDEPIGGDDEETKPPATGALADSTPSGTDPQWMFVLLHEEGGAHRESSANIVGVYSTISLAADGAKKRFETLSHGCYENGRFIEPELFETVVDNTSKIRDGEDDGDGDDGGFTSEMLYQEDREGAWVKLSVQKILVDERIESKRKTKRFRRW